MFTALMERETRIRDVDSFSRLIEPLLDQAFRVAAVMLNDRDAAEDAVQEAAVKAWRKIRQLRDADAVRPWFLSIVANECRMSRRKRWWSVIKLGVISSPRDEEESYADLRRALLQLSPQERFPLVLHFYLDLPVDEVARAMHVSSSAAKARIYRAAKKLRADLTMEDVIR